MPSGLLNLDQFCTLYAFRVMNFGSLSLFLVREIEGGFLMISLLFEVILIHIA